MKNLVAAIFRLEQHNSSEAILEVVANLIEWLAAPEQTRLRRSFSLWINRVLKPVTDSNTPNLTDLVEIKTMLSQRVSQWQKQFEQQGLEKGNAEGQITRLRKLVSLKFGVLPDWAQQKLNNAKPNELDIWSERLFTTDSLEQLFDS